MKCLKTRKALEEASGQDLNGFPGVLAVKQSRLLSNCFKHCEGIIAVTGSNTTVITVGTGTLGSTVSNSAASGANNLNYILTAGVQSGSATLGSVNPASGSLTPGASQPSSVSATSTNLGANTISFTAADPNASNSPQTTTATLTVLGHSNPALSVRSGNGQTIITGGALATVTLTLPNGTLNQTGLAPLDVNSLGFAVTGSTGGDLVASGSARSYTATLSSGTLGAQVETFSLNVGDDHTLSGALSPTNVSAGVSLTVMDHANASLSSTANQTNRTINFGSVLKGAAVPSQNFTIYNRAVNTTAAYTAALNLTGFSAPGDPALTTTILPFGGVSAGGHVTYTANLNTSNNTITGSNTVTMTASQLTDDSNLPGAGNNNNGGISITLQGNVGNATADASNSPTAFGTALTAPVAQNASYANLASTVTATTGSGGQSMVGTTATILAGTASVSTTASMAWRKAASNERFVSDVLDLSGIGVVDGQTRDGSVHTDTFVLQMNYSPLSVQGRTGLSELGAAEAGLIQMDYLDSLDNQWESAVLGNFGSSNDYFVGVGPWSGEMALGDWGVNTSNHTVWAVLDHNSDFAVTPEPSTLTLLAAGAVGLAGFVWRRRRRKHYPSFDGGSILASGDESDSQEEGPVILSVPSRLTKAARRAA